MSLNDITTIGMLLLGIISLCVTIHNSISNVKVELANIRGELREYVTHGQCSEKREHCPCLAELKEVKHELHRNA